MPQNKMMTRNEPELSASENMILHNIRHYFAMKSRRQYVQGKEGSEASKLIGQIQSSIRSGIISDDLLLAYEVPPHIYVRNRPISRSIVEGWFLKVADWLMEKAKMSAPQREKEYAGLME